MSSGDEATRVDGDGDEKEKIDLQVEITSAGPCLKHVAVTIPRAEIDRAFGMAIEEMSETANVPGFRAGHAPKGLLQKKFREELQNQVRQTLLVGSLDQISSDHDLEPINDPDLDVQAIEIPEEGDFEYEFNVEVRPEFDLPDYTGLPIEQPKVEVTEEEVASQQQRFLTGYGSFVPYEGAAQVGDLLTLSATFTRDGEELRELDEFTATLRPVLRFQDAELESFGELFVGAEIGAKKSADLIVSREAETIGLRGETVHAEFKLLDLKRLEMPALTADFFDRIEIDDVEDLQNRIRETLERQRTYRARQNARSQVLSKITESADWELPESLVARQVENALRREILEMQQAGFSAGDIRSRENQLRQNAITTTRQALKEHFVLDRIAEREKIVVGPAEIEQEITLMAMQQGESPRRLRSRLEKSGMIENLEAQLRERKAIDYILERADIREIPAPPAEPIDRVEAVSHSICAAPATSDLEPEASPELVTAGGEETDESDAT